MVFGPGPYWVNPKLTVSGGGVDMTRIALYSFLKNTAENFTFCCFLYGQLIAK